MDNALNTSEIIHRMLRLEAHEYSLGGLGWKAAADNVKLENTFITIDLKLQTKVQDI